MTRYLLPCFLITCCVWASGICADPLKNNHAKSPHAEALDVVFATQQRVIAAVDTETWWHDVKERQWLVKRPFGPGVYDSTHLFGVTYRVDGEEVATWFVDTREKSAERQDVAGAKKEQHIKDQQAVKEQYVLATRTAVESLRSNIENFRLSLIYHGVNAGKGRSLHLSVAALPDVSSATDLVVRIDRDQAASLIGLLATDGILYRGTINREKLRAHPNKPYYELWVTGDEKDQYFDDLPLNGASRRWPGTTGPTLIQQIDNLRAVLTGDAGKAMDALRETLDTPGQFDKKAG